jgi:hypothetical protein
VGCEPFPLSKRFPVSLSDKAYQRLWRLNGKFGYGNNYLPAIPPEHFDVVANQLVFQKVFSALALEYGTPAWVARSKACGRGRSPLAGMSGAYSNLCAPHSSSRATTVALGLIECLAPVGQKLGDEGMFLIRLHG